MIYYWTDGRQHGIYLLIARTYTCVSFQAIVSINRIGSPFFNVKREQEITKEEIAMPFLHLFARGAQVLNADYRFNLKADIFRKSSS